MYKYNKHKTGELYYTGIIIWNLVLLFLLTLITQSREMLS
jgi:hypothetical protein